MVPTVPLVGGSILSVIVPVVLGLVFAVLAGMALAAAERRSMIPAAVREEQRRQRELRLRPVPAMPRAA